MYNHNENSNNITPTTARKSASVDIRQIFPARKKDDFFKDLQKDVNTYSKYLDLNNEWRNRFEEFMEGNKSLPLTYDPFFKALFNPDVYPGRLSHLLSSIIGINVTVQSILSQENRLLPTSPLLIMDIIVQLEDGSIANVEIQKIHYAFSGERMSCYSSDLLLRQYTRVKGEKGDQFTYHDIKTVYTIVMFEDSPPECKSSDIFIHHGKTIFNTGIDLHLLQEYYVIALDVFKNNKYAKEKNALNAWLALLTADSINDLATLISDYPWMEKICRDMSEYLYRPKEVIGMYSQALAKADENTVNYMIEQMKKTLEEKDATISEKDAALSEKDAALSEKDAEIAALQAKLAALGH